MGKPDVYLREMLVKMLVYLWKSIKGNQAYCSFMQVWDACSAASHIWQSTTRDHLNAQQTWMRLICNFQNMNEILKNHSWIFRNPFFKKYKTEVAANTSYMFWWINWIHIEVNRTKMVNFPPPVVAMMKFYVNYAEYSEFPCACQGLNFSRWAFKMIRSLCIKMCVWEKYAIPPL